MRPRRDASRIGRFRSVYVIARQRQASAEASDYGDPNVSTLLIIVILVLLFGGGGYYGFNRYGGRGLGGVLGLLLLIIVVLWLVGGLQGLNLGRM